MDQEMKNILQRLELSVGKLEEGQTKTNSKLDRMEKRFDQKFNAVDNRFDAVDQKFENIDNRFNAVDQKFEKVDNRFNAVDSRLSKLETGQEELKHLLKHHTTLQTDNFTNIRQDLGRKRSETNSDINLLFRKTEKKPKVLGLLSSHSNIKF